MLFVLKTIPVFSSTSFNSEVREITISISFPSPSLLLTIFKSSISALPLNFTASLFSSEIFPAIPPTWNG